VVAEVVKVVLEVLAVQEELAELAVTVLTTVLNGILVGLDSLLATSVAVFITLETATLWEKDVINITMPVNVIT
jgi:hypothetical protein